MPFDWSTFGVDLHLELEARIGEQRPAVGRRVSLERAMRDAIRRGQLTPASRLPSTRALAAELGFARGTVKAAYDQLIAEGYLTARTGSGTVVGAPLGPAAPATAPATTATTATTAARATTAAATTAPPRYDLRPGSPDVTSFPTHAWLRAAKRALAAAPSSAYDYAEPAGRIELRTALAAYLGRARGVIASPDRIVITSGYVQALSLLASAGVGGGSVAMEDPGLDFHRDVVRRAGATVVALSVDDDGARTDLLSTKDYCPVRAVVVTPAHQYPLGVTLHPDRRHIATEWARACDGLIIEDDYDGEFRYDRQPVGAVQGMAPEHVAYVGTASKTLAPGIRLAWMVLPERLVQPVLRAKRLTDMHTEVIGQLTLAEFIASHAYDRHVRAARLRYRRRRDLLIGRLWPRRGEPYAVHGIAAGLHVMISLPENGTSEAELLAAAAARGLAVGDLASHWHGPGEHIKGLVVGYGRPSEGAYPAAVDTLARVLRSTVSG